MFSEADQESSLFGSPPPSPSTGRSPSPFLALPSATGGLSLPSDSRENGPCPSTAQNVGTIALPGSHHFSELSVDPIASSSSPSAPRPPALPVSIRQTHTQMSQPVSRASSRAAGRKTKGKEKDNTPSKLSSIVLPNSDTPPGAKFLRNQLGLLGRAGVVGGLCPANLSVQRGSTPSNPIIVEDEPMLGQSRRLPLVNPALLPTPSNDQIIKSLIKQKNIFPILGSILKLFAARDSHFPPVRTGFERRSSGDRSDSTPPMKKRRLGKVPAGAVDWDVPYPFLDGQGPQEYRTNWELERGKQLISQLVGLIKNAATKAATKAYLNEQRKSRLHSSARAFTKQTQGNYSPSTFAQGLESNSSVSPQLGDRMPNQPSIDGVRNISEGSENVYPTSAYQLFGGTSSSGAESQSEASIDSWLASLLESPVASMEGVSSTLGSTSVGASTPTCEEGQATAGPIFETSPFESWISILHNFPAPEAWNGISGVAAEHALLPDSTALNELNSLINPSLNDYNYNLDPFVSNTPSQSHTHSSTTPVPTFIAQSAIGNQDDFIIDPLLLTMSIPPSSNAPRTPSLVQSPIPSASSFDDPMTPNWDSALAEPEIYSGERNQGMYRPPSDSSKDQAEPQSTADLHSALKRSAPARAVSTLSAKPSNTKQPSATAAARMEVLRRGKERKMQLVAAIEKAKIELWESTLEQGVLAQIVKDLGNA